jgi:hypothetical protein
VLRGLPDALNPTPESPFGWFYLPTDTGGAEITSANLNRDATRAFGYNIHPLARDRNPAENSPDGDGLQPFSASLTPLPVARLLADGRNLSSVFQSRYTKATTSSRRMTTRTTMSQRTASRASARMGSSPPTGSRSSTATNTAPRTRPPVCSRRAPSLMSRRAQ